ncbi:MAG TPA: nitrate reductase associated protein [Chitinophagaceae bacterium]|nr:nitrate reductase associated protein [Chitinophagaceae bacterium]
MNLAFLPGDSSGESSNYNRYLTGYRSRPFWSDLHSIPGKLTEKLNEFNWKLSIKEWKRLTNLQRFALLKRCRAKHENTTFPKQ